MTGSASGLPNWERQAVPDLNFKWFSIGQMPDGSTFTYYP